MNVLVIHHFLEKLTAIKEQLRLRLDQMTNEPRVYANPGDDELQADEHQERSDAVHQGDFFGEDRLRQRRAECGGNHKIERVHHR